MTRKRAVDIIQTVVRTTADPLCRIYHMDVAFVWELNFTAKEIERKEYSSTELY